MNARSMVLLLCALLAGSAAHAGAIPGPLSLDGRWHFKWAEDAKAADPLRWFFEDGYDVEAWDTIPVPSHWALLGYEDPRWVDGSPAEGFYVHTFSVPAEANNLRTLLHFDGVWVSAEVWLNGQALGRHDSGFTAFAFDVTDCIKPGKENRLCVRVRQQIPGLLFKFDANDDWALAGIYRGVWLESMPKEMVIASVEVETDFDALYKDADLNLRVFVSRQEGEEYIKPSPPFDIRAVLSDSNGTEVARTSRTATLGGGHNGNDLRLSLRVPSPRHWTAETPDLYALAVELVRDNKVTHGWKGRVGFREVSWSGGVLRVNGQAVKLRGVARHDEHPDVGRATRPEHWVQDIRLMKEANINAVRTAHYPPAEGFIRLCDEMGLYVLDEIPLGYGGDRMENPIFGEGMWLRIHETIQRDRNHPCVIVWSFGNEDPFTPLHLAGLRAIKGLDPTRPVLLPFRAEIDLPAEVDILAPHYGSASEYDRLAASSVRPIITTEYTHALGRQDFGEMEQRWQALTRHPAGAGAMIWLWADEGLRRSVKGRTVLDPMGDKDKYARKGGELIRESDAGPGEIYDTHGHWGADGIVDSDRTPQRDYWEVRAVYEPVEVVSDRIPFRPGQDHVSVDIHNGYDFLDLSTVELTWRLFRDDRPIDSGKAGLQAPPHMTATLEIPTTAIKAGDRNAVYYVHLTPQRKQHARKIHSTTESVRLDTGPVPQPPGPAKAARPRVTRTQDRTVVEAGPARYEFDPCSAEITGISINGLPVAGRSKVVVWRPATYCERGRLDVRANQHNWNTYMQGLAGVAKQWEVAESGQALVISNEVEYRQDDLNRVIAHIVYGISSEGTLAVELDVQPLLDVPEIPEIGIELAVPAALKTLTWLGEGPMDSLPGKSEATYFGWWQSRPGDAVLRGTRSGIEWARLGYESGAALHVKGCAGVRLEGQALRILTHLAAPWTKNGPAENPQWQLSLGKGERFKGSFELIPINRE